MTPTTTTFPFTTLSDQAVRIIELLRQRQYEAVERAMGKPIQRPNPGPHVPTWPAPNDTTLIPGIAIKPMDFFGLSMPTSTPAMGRGVGVPDHLPKSYAQTITKVLPFPPPKDGRAHATSAHGATTRHERYAKAFAPGRTLAQAHRLGATHSDIRHAIDNSLIELAI